MKLPALIEWGGLLGLLGFLIAADRFWVVIASDNHTTNNGAPIHGGSKQAPELRRQDLPYYSQAERLVQEDIKKSVIQAKQGPERGARRHIRVVTVVAPPFMMKREAPAAEVNDQVSQQRRAQASVGRDTTTTTHKNGTNNNNNSNKPATIEWYGYCMDFFQELLKYLPYEMSYEIYEVPDGKFGSKAREILVDENNNKSQPVRREYWNGMIGELAMGRAHLALAPMAVMAERELVVDFTVPFYDLVGIQILLKRPEVPRDWFKFLTVLDNEVWLSITVAYFVTSLIIYLFDRLSPYSHKNMKRVEKIKSRRRDGVARAAVATARSAPMGEPPTGPGGGQSARGESSLALKPLSKQQETFGAAPSGIIYPLFPGNGIRAISHGGEPLVGAVPSATRTGPTKDHLQLVGAGSQPRRLSQDYLRSLRIRRLSSTGRQEETTWGSGGGQHQRPTLAAKSVCREANLDELCDELDSQSDDYDDGVPEFNLRDSLWFCITSLTPQGGGEAPQNLSGRVVAGAWWLFCFIVIASYTANLAAFLTVSRLDIPIESLDDLAKQYRIKYAPIEGTAEQSFFERMAYIEEIFYNIWKEMSLNDSLSEEERSKFAVWDYPISDKYTKIWAQIQEIQMPTSLSQAIERVKSSNLDDGFALLASANVIRYATMTDCSFRAVGEEFSRKPIALALQKELENLRDDLSYAILQLINKRYMEVLREKWWTNNPGRVVCDLNDESEGISIENIGGVFIIILAGVLLSFLVWAAEQLLYKAKLEVSRGLLEMGTDSLAREQRKRGAEKST